MLTGRADLDARLKVSEMPADEPWFVLRAQDLCADAAVRHYAQVVIARGGPVALAEKALQQADAMSDWRTRKLPDIDLPEAERLNLEYRHSRRGQVRSGELEVSYAYERGVSAGAARSERVSRAELAHAERRGREAVLAAIRSTSGQEVLGWPNFRCGPYAHLRAATGETIRSRAEQEQAHVLTWLLELVVEHGEGWAAEAQADVERRRKLLAEAAA